MATQVMRAAILAALGCGRVDFDHVSDGAVPDAPMAVITAAQAIVNNSTTATTPLVFPDPIQQGDAIIVCFTFPSGTLSLASVSDSLDNAYSVVVGPVTANNYDHYVAVASSSPAGSDTVTVTLSAAGGNWEVLALEYTGLALTDPFDTDADASGSGTVMSSGSVSTSSAHELLLAYGHSNGPMVGAGYTAVDAGSESMVEDEVVFAAGSYTATAATTPGIWTLILTAFVGR